MGDIKTDIEAFLEKMGVTCYRLCKEAKESGNTMHFILKGKRQWMLNRTEQRIREAMGRLSKSNV